MEQELWGQSEPGGAEDEEESGVRLHVKDGGVEVRPSRPDNIIPAEFRQRTLTVRLDCQRCGASLPLQGPTRTVRCAHCQEDSTFSAHKLAQLIQFAAMDVRESDGFKTSDGGHPCPACGALMDSRAIPWDVESMTSCACGAAIAASPPPAWLKEELPALMLLVGAELDPGDEPSTADVTSPAGEAKPVVLDCPCCKASLKITGATERTSTCEFCEAEVYLPDDLWRSIHPGRTPTPWTAVYQGEYLWTSRDLRREERRARQEAEQQEHLRAQQEKDRLAQEQRQAAQRASRQRTLIVGALILVTAAGLLVFFISR